MPISLPVIRAILLGAALLQLVFAVAPIALRRRAVDAALKAGGAPGHVTPASVRSVFMSRVPTMVMALVPIALWWFLGTPGGEAFFSDAFQPR